MAETMRDRGSFPCSLGCLLVVVGYDAFVWAQPKPQAPFVQVRDGHLYRGEERIRLWGVNIHGPGARGSDYGKVDANVRRIRVMGFNAVRLWGGRAFLEVRDDKRIYRTYTKGDRSWLDVMDYCIARLKEEGLVIWLTWFDYHTVTPGDADLIDDPATKEEWIRAVKALEKPQYRRGRQLIFYFDPRAKAAFKEHITKVLNHINQYTGLAIKDDPVFAIYELDNETQFMDNMLGIKGKAGWGHSSVEEILPPFFVEEVRRQWNEFLRRKHGTGDALRKTWGGLRKGESLKRGTVQLQPTYATAKEYPEARGSDIVTFYRQLFVSTCREITRHIHQQGKPGRGCSVVPIIFHTVASVHGLHIAYSNSFGDAVAYGDYWMQYADEGRLKRKPPLHYPWYSFVEGGWGWGFVHPYKQANKPLLLYEINCYRTDRFRAEFPLLHAIGGCWSDLDGIFFYIWDYGFSRDEKMLTSDRLYYPTTDHGPHGYVSYSDEVFLSQAYVAGVIFSQGLLKPPPEPTIVRYGRNDLNDIRQKWYGILHRIFPTHLRYGVRIAFDPKAEETKVEGPTIGERAWDEQGWKVGEVLQWDREEGSLRLELTAAKSAAGFLPPDLAFRDGVQIKGIRKLWFDSDDLTPPTDGKAGSYRPYYVFTMVSENGQPLPEAKRIWISLVSTSQNAGFAFDPRRAPVTGASGQKMAHGILSLGTAPVQVNRVGATLIIPFAKGWRYRKLDFALRPFEEGTMKGEVVIAPTDPVFLLILERP